VISTTDDNTAATRPLIGISACLQGEAVRYDGQNRLQRDLLAALSPFVGWLGFCPEMTAGFGVPRPPVKLVESSQGIRAQNQALAIDCTEALTHTSRTFWQSHQNLNGYVFKSRSPSCGLESTPLFDQDNRQVTLSSGLFAREAQSAQPDLPMVEEAWLDSPDRRLRFLTACYLHWYQQHSDDRHNALMALCIAQCPSLGSTRFVIDALLDDDNNTALTAALSHYWNSQKTHQAS